MGGGDYFAHGRFPEVGQKQKTEKKEERMNDGKNNGQATHLNVSVSKIIFLYFTQYVKKGGIY